MEIRVKQGVLKGTRSESLLSGKPYYSFLGIPYAKPPLGDLRFQPPQPAESWHNDVYDATHEREPSLQVGTFLLLGLVGSEDCLHLNVFTPMLPSEIKTPKAVMVFFHGGGFTFGTGSKLLYSADYLLQKDVIVVTVNYRLNILGFLNLNLSDCKGNAGMKDQVFALRWIKENIISFGGNAENVTIFGQSAGASAVHFHTISPMSKGLFHKAILQSGFSLSPWAITYKPEAIAFQVGRKLGFLGNDAEKLFDFFKKESAVNLVRATADVEAQLKHRYPGSCSTRPFTVTVEKFEENAFLNDIPENLLPAVVPVPTIFGSNDKEAIYLYNANLTKELVKMIKNDLTKIVSNNFRIERSEVADLTNKITKLYLNDKKPEEITKEDFLDLYTDIMFFRFYNAIYNGLNSHVPTYVYQFRYDGSFNTMKKFALSEEAVPKGAAHGDELGYLFLHEFLPSQPKATKNDLKVIENMTTLWTNFAKTTDPTYNMPNVKWNSCTLKEMCYLTIDEDLQMINGDVYGGRLAFWKEYIGCLKNPYDVLF